MMNVSILNVHTFKTYRKPQLKRFTNAFLRCQIFGLGQKYKKKNLQKNIVLRTIELSTKLSDDYVFFINLMADISLQCYKVNCNQGKLKTRQYLPNIILCFAILRMQLTPP